MICVRSLLGELTSIHHRRRNSWRTAASTLEDSQQATRLADAASATLVLHGRARHSDRVRPSRTLNLSQVPRRFSVVRHAPPNATAVSELRLAAAHRAGLPPLWIRTCAGHLRLREGFHFEAVISVWTTTRRCCQQAGRGIGNEEEWT